MDKKKEAEFMELVKARKLEHKLAYRVAFQHLPNFKPKFTRFVYDFEGGTYCVQKDLSGNRTFMGQHGGVWARAIAEVKTGESKTYVFFQNQDIVGIEIIKVWDLTNH